MHPRSPAEAEALLARIARDQFGLFSLAQARAAGLGYSAVKRRVDAGRLERILPGVFGWPGMPNSWERELMGATLWAGEGSAASHRAAAVGWGFEGFRRRQVEISSVRATKPHRLPFVVHRVSPSLVPEITTIGALPVTSVRRTLLDLSGIKDPRVERALDHALLLRLTSLGQLWLLYEEEWTRRRRGIAILRHLLVARSPSTAPPHSELERMFERLVDEHRLPDPVKQFPINLSFGWVHPDFAYPVPRVAIELDSYAWHMDRRAFERDRERDNELQRLGWRVLRFTWAMLKWEPARVAALIRASLPR